MTIKIEYKDSIEVIADELFWDDKYLTYIDGWYIVSDGNFYGIEHKAAYCEDLMHALKHYGSLLFHIVDDREVLEELNEIYGGN